MESVKKFFKPLTLFLFILVAFSAMSHGLVPLRASQDFWWHLKAGKVIVEGGYQLPEYDVFSYTSADIEWHNHEYITQVVMYWVYQIGEGIALGSGVKANIFVKALVITAAFLVLFVLIVQRTGHAPIAAFVTILALNTSRFTMYPRPPVVTYLFLAIFLFAAYRYVYHKMNRKWLIVLLPLMILWVNMHGGFVLGLIVLGSFWSGELILWFFKKDKEHLQRGLTLLGVFVACIICTFINPYGYHLYEIFINVMSDKELIGNIPELLPPPFEHATSFVLMFSLLGFVVALQIIFKLLKRPMKAMPHPGEYMMAAFFLQQALTHVRHLPIFAITTAVMLATIVYNLIPPEMKNDFTEEPLEATDSGKRNALELVCTIFIVILAFGLTSYYFYQQDTFYINGTSYRESTYRERNRRFFSGDGTRPGKYPVKICDFIINNKFHGNMFNHINDSGYLIWRLSPELHKTFTDDRYDIFGGKFWRVHNDILGCKPGWKEQLEKWDINFVLLGSGRDRFYLDVELEEDEGWVQIDPFNALQRENGMIFYIKNIPENQELIKRCQNSVKRLRIRGR